MEKWKCRIVSYSSDIRRYLSCLFKYCINAMKIYVHATKVLRNLWIFLVLFAISNASASTQKGHSRQKRILWVTSDGRLALPPGTTLVIAPSLSLPFVRYPPEGFFSNLTISLPFTIDFSKLGLTDNENPYGVLPPLLARSMGTTVADLLGKYIEKMFYHHKYKRHKRDEGPEMPDSHKNAFHGGERALLYLMVQEFLENFGMDGKACLLRAICEVHAHPLKNYGFVGEIAKLFLSASKSPYAHLLQEYVEAENAGKGGPGSPGECWPYIKDCPKSLFLPKHNKYSSDILEEEIIEKESNSIGDKKDEANEVTYKPGVQM